MKYSDQHGSARDCRAVAGLDGVLAAPTQAATARLAALRLDAAPSADGAAATAPQSSPVEVAMRHLKEHHAHANAVTSVSLRLPHPLEVQRCCSALVPTLGREVIPRLGLCAHTLHHAPSPLLIRHIMSASSKTCVLGPAILITECAPSSCRCCLHRMMSQNTTHQQFEIKLTGVLCELLPPGR